MLNFILLLFGLTFPNSNVYLTSNNTNFLTIQNSSIGNIVESENDTGGETGPILPPKK